MRCGNCRVDGSEENAEGGRGVLWVRKGLLVGDAEVELWMEQCSCGR